MAQSLVLMEHRLFKSSGQEVYGERCMDMRNGEWLANALQEIMAPCQYCQYNGENYYQAQSHAPTCRWYTVGGQFERARILVNEMEMNSRSTRGIL